MQCGKEFSEFKVDLSMRIPSMLLPLNKFNSISDCTVETLLEYAAAQNEISGGNELFEYLLSHGAQFDSDAPYLPLSFAASPHWSPLFRNLENRGASKQKIPQYFLN